MKGIECQILTRLTLEMIHLTGTGVLTHKKIYDLALYPIVNKNSETPEYFSSQTVYGSQIRGNDRRRAKIV